MIFEKRKKNRVIYFGLNGYSTKNVSLKLFGLVKKIDVIYGIHHANHTATYPN